MNTTLGSSVNISTRQQQLAILNKNLNTLLEREAKYGGNAPLELINQINDHQEAIALIKQTLAGQLSEKELADALKPLLLAFDNGQVVNITADTYVAGDQIIQNISQISERALTAAEEAEKARTIACQRLAEGVRQYAQRLASMSSTDGETAASTRSPYKGLLAYHLNDADCFFGRDQAIAELLGNLQRGPLTILHAESGAGKSSLLQAGIQNRLLGQGHLPVHLRPYNQSPTLAIKRIFLPDLGSTSGTNGREEATSSDICAELINMPLRNFLTQVTNVLGPDTTLYLLIDQFEEVFTLLDDDERQGFVDELADCLEDESLNVRWLLALRTEFFGNLATFRPRIRNPFENDYRLNRLNLVEARTVITEPAARVGVTFEPELVGTLLTDLHDEHTDEISPPQIQLVCSALYSILQKQQAENPDLPPTITLAMYQEEGGAQGILRGYLNRVLRRTLSPKERELARQLLVALVSSNHRRVRRTQSDLAATLATFLTGGQSLNDLLDQLVESRLLNVEEDEQTDELAYELAHDYLLTEIEIDPETQARKAAEELLKQEVDAYKRYGTLLSSDKFDIIHSQQEFLKLNQDAEKLLQLSQAAQRRAQVKRFAAIITIGLLIIGASVAIAWLQTRAAKVQETLAAEAAAAEATAVAERNIALSRQLAAQSVNEPNSELALLLAVEAGKAADIAEAHEALHRALANPLRSQVVLEGHEGPLRGAFWNKDETQILTFSRDGTVRVWEAKTNELLLKLSEHTEDIRSAMWNKDETRILTGSNDGSAKVWDAQTGECLQTFQHHEQQRVMFATWNRDETQILTTGEDGLAHIWDVETGERLLSLRGHNKWIWRGSWSPDGTYIVTASEDGTARVWNATTGEIVHILQHELGIRVGWAIWNKDGSIILTSSNDRTARIWDATTGEEALRLVGHTDYVRQTQWNADETRILTVSDDGQARIWDAITGETLVIFQHPDQVTNAVWNADGSRILTACNDGIARIWDAKIGGKELVSLIGHSDAINQASWNHDESRILTASTDNTARIWKAEINIEGGDELPIFSGHTNEIWQAIWNNDGTRILTASYDHTAKVWDAETGQGLVALIGHKEIVNQATWNAAESLILTASYDNTARVWNAESGQPVVTLVGHTDRVRKAIWNTNEDKILTLSDDATAKIWDATGNILTLTGHEGSIIWGMWNRDNSLILTGSDDATARVWDAKTGDELFSLTGHAGTVNQATWNNEENRILTASADGTARVWDAKTGFELFSLTGHTDEIYWAVWSPSEEWILTASADGTARVWNAETEQEKMRLFSSNGADMGHAIWNANGQRILTASDDGLARVWDAKTGEIIAILPGHTGWVVQATWNPDETRILTASTDNTARQYYTQLADLINEACRRLNRNMNPAEWKQFMGNTEYQATCSDITQNNKILN